MMDNDNFSENSQLTLSYELLSLLRWLANHDEEKLKRIITRALSSGLHEELKKEQRETLDQESSLESDVQHSIIDFLGLLEVLLFEAINEQTVKKALQKNLMPAIDHIDTSVCDDATVRFSVEKATTSADRNPQESPKDMLFKELLKRWKPSKKTILN